MRPSMLLAALTLTLLGAALASGGRHLAKRKVVRAGRVGNETLPELSC